MDCQSTFKRQWFGSWSAVGQVSPNGCLTPWPICWLDKSRYHPSAVCYYRGDGIFVLYVKKSGVTERHRRVSVSAWSDYSSWTIYNFYQRSNNIFIVSLSFPGNSYVYNVIVYSTFNPKNFPRTRFPMIDFCQPEMFWRCIMSVIFQFRYCILLLKDVKTWLVKMSLGLS